MFHYSLGGSGNSLGFVRFSKGTDHEGPGRDWDRGESSSRSNETLVVLGLRVETFEKGVDLPD